MNIFNSLGSNYDGNFVWRSIVMPGTRWNVRRVREILGMHFHGQATLTYKGRQALELALMSSGLPKGSGVGINGFTCYVVYQAVERAGYQPVMLDVAKGELNFGVDELKKAHDKSKNLKAIIVQNTLGLPADMPALADYCKERDILIIEDLAHSLGACYSDGREAGTVGAFTMLSFSQDKPLDVVAGGALIDRRGGKETIIQPKSRVSLWQREKNALYPFWTTLIRTTYPVGLGRYLHFGLKKLHLLATPMGDNRTGTFTMEPSAANFLLKRWALLDTELEHRRTIAGIYRKILPESVQFSPPAKSEPSYLRFPLLVKDRAAFVAHLKTKGLYIGDTWYRAPVDSGRLMEPTSYEPGDCPRAEELAKHIVNLPTHRHVSKLDAERIAKGIKSWLTSQ